MNGHWDTIVEAVRTDRRRASWCAARSKQYQKVAARPKPSRYPLVRFGVCTERPKAADQRLMQTAYRAGEGGRLYAPHCRRPSVSSDR